MEMNVKQLEEQAKVLSALKDELLKRQKLVNESISRVDLMLKLVNDLLKKVGQLGANEAALKGMLIKLSDQTRIEYACIMSSARSGDKQKESDLKDSGRCDCCVQPIKEDDGGCHDDCDDSDPG